ncbi:MAG: type I DNA topoisomerase [Hellea sp.]|nr:type I DNA topoisomerase [Hellea sp.]
MNLVIVESPAKAKTIEKYLGKDYKVLASFGHIRDLPSKNGSVDPEQDFAMTWAVDTKSKSRVKDIETALKNSDKLILATDPDREGEAISWHLLEVLKKKKALKDKKIERVVFNAITKKSVTEAIAHPRELDMELVDAYLARRALDYLVGFTLSPVLWRKLPGSRSAGRVQSVSLRLICERENEIEKFVAQEYWTVDAAMKTADGKDYEAKLVALDGTKLDKFSLASESSAMAAKQLVDGAALSIRSVEAKPVKRRPYAPFTTSSLQQEASRKLGFSATRTMQTAQKLYEGIDIGGETVGLITYMRTDGISMVGEAIQEARAIVGSEFGDIYLPKSPRVYKNKAKNAQEAHEAIRPTSFARVPGRIKLSGDQAKLYDLIWKRAMASQMEDARLERTTIEIADDENKVGLRASGSVLKFDGFLKLYEAAKAITDKDEEDSGLLPEVERGETTSASNVNADQHFTQPPPRYSEASLVKKMEELGIGRPSTYASTLKTLESRDYVTIEKRRITPSDKGRLVTAFLENFFAKYVQYDYTADLEERLDRVSAGDLGWKKLLHDFWDMFSAHVDGTKELRVSQVLDALNVTLAPLVFPPREDGKDARACSSCDDGELSLKVGKFGAFVGCSNYPDCKFTRPFGQGDDADAGEKEDKMLGQDPETGIDVFLKNGRFGPYVQLGEEKRPKRTSLPKNWPYESIDLEKALRLLSLPREIGKHPEDGEPITGAIGRYGPYILHAGTYVNLPTADEMFEVGINRAVTMLAEKRANGGGRGRGAAAALKDLGKHPETEKPVRVMDGRYGPYVKYEKINATIPKGTKPEEVTMEMALEYIAAKEAKGGKKKKKAPAKKKKAAAKKKAKT